MRRLLRDEALHAHLDARGWARLPPLDPATLDALVALARELEATLVRHAMSSDVGFDELWGNADFAVRKAAQARIAAVLDPFLHRAFEGHRAVLFNIFTKRARSPESRVPFHQDFAAIDERGGETALQLWIPLVDVARDNGALVLVEGSHLDAPAIRPHDAQHPLGKRSPADLPPGGVQPTLRAGEGVVFTNRTVHASTPNVGERDRPAAGVILVPKDITITHWVEPTPGRFTLWALTDDQLLALQPGKLPEGATLLDTVVVEGPTP